jgi:hypothetical protein
MSTSIILARPSNLSNTFSSSDGKITAIAGRCGEFDNAHVLEVITPKGTYHLSGDRLGQNLTRYTGYAPEHFLIAKYDKGSIILSWTPYRK